jgi:DNA-binding IclR family transcriptional regulator
MNRVLDESIEDVLQRVRGEYFEMPGLQLTSAQASRLWGLDITTCQRLLRTLVDSQFLTRTPDGRYRRAES